MTRSRTAADRRCPTCRGEGLVREETLILPYNTHGVISAIVLCPTCHPAEEPKPHDAMHRKRQAADKP